MTEPVLLKAPDVLSSPARVLPAERAPMRVGVVQESWHANADEHLEALAASIQLAARTGARLICLQELTLSPYFAARPSGPTAQPEDIPDGPTSRFVCSLSAETGTYVQASLYERAHDGWLGFDTAIVASPNGKIITRTRKLHIPSGAGYHEDHYFRPGPDQGAYEVVEIEQGRFGFPTCWDQWFPELARIYSMRGAEVLVYPSAIGSEPDHPDFDTCPLWERVIIANGIMNGTFMIAANRTGMEDNLTFYGSSFISDPYGRKLVQAPRDQPAVLIADLDLDQRRDWLDLFSFLGGRRPEVYGDLVSAPDVEQDSRSRPTR